jgi:hypothetical protein
MRDAIVSLHVIKLMRTRSRAFELKSKLWPICIVLLIALAKLAFHGLQYMIRLEMSVLWMIYVHNLMTLVQGTLPGGL